MLKKFGKGSTNFGFRLSVHFVSRAKTTRRQNDSTSFSVVFSFSSLHYFFAISESFLPSI